MNERDKNSFLTFLQTNAKSDGLYFYQTILDLHGSSMWILLNQLNKTTTLTKPPKSVWGGLVIPKVAYCDVCYTSISDDHLQIPAEILFPFNRPKSAH